MFRFTIRDVLWLTASRDSMLPQVQWDQSPVEGTRAWSSGQPPSDAPQGGFLLVLCL